MAATGIAGVVVALDCAAGTLLVPVGVTTNVNVAADTTLTDAVTLTDRSAIEKTGVGKLTLSGGQFTQDKAVDLRVREAAAALTASPQTLASYPQPTETMNKAAFWLESRTNLVKDGDDIVEWRDVRDVDPTATNHYYAVTDNTVSDLCPQEATYTFPGVRIRLLDELAEPRRRTGDGRQPPSCLPRAWRELEVGICVGAKKGPRSLFPAGEPGWW